MKTIQPMSLQHARKKAGISLKVMADILRFDPSNLSKYERGVHSPNKNIILDYHLLTNAKLEDLFAESLKNRVNVLSYQLEGAVEKLGVGTPTRKVETMVLQFKHFLKKLNPLNEASKQRYE